MRLTQEALAERAGLSVETISLLERSGAHTLRREAVLAEYDICTGIGRCYHLLLLDE